MPTLTVPRPTLLGLLDPQSSIRQAVALGDDAVREAVNKTCFEYGIELEHLSAEEKAANCLDLKFDIPANRPDLCCAEGVAQALNVFEGVRSTSDYAMKVTEPTGDRVRMIVDHSVEETLLRPHVVAAVLRGLTLTPEAYASFIDFQDKLHMNICRRRALVAIGTHFIDAVEAPFTYQMAHRDSFKFKPLNKDVAVDGDGLLAMYEGDAHLGPFLPLISHSPVFPLITDNNGEVLSLPPIINGDRSKMYALEEGESTDILIECTATDRHRADIVLSTIVSIFSTHCKEPFTVEQVEIVRGDKTELTPVVAPRVKTFPRAEITRVVGMELGEEKMASLLKKMGLTVVSDDVNGDISVSIPPTRSDVIHGIDVAEDVAVAYGLNNLPQPHVPTATIGSLLPTTRRAEATRAALSTMGITEICSFALCSEEEACLSTMTTNPSVAKVNNAKSPMYAALRTGLLAGLLRTCGLNNDAPRPLRLFEVGEIVDFSDIKLVKDGERLITPELPPATRSAAVLFSESTAPFSDVHGTLDHLSHGLGFKYSLTPDATEDTPKLFIPGRSARINVVETSKGSAYTAGEMVGRIGIVHPSILMQFDIEFPVAVFEIKLI